MNRFTNFPASTSMTEFEIVEIQNDMLRQRRFIEDNEEQDVPTSSESDDDSSDDESYTMIDNQNIDLPDDDIASDLIEDEFFEDIPIKDIECTDIQIQNDEILNCTIDLQSVTDTSDSNDSNQSMYKTPPNSMSILAEKTIIQEINKIPIEINDITFLERLNYANRQWGPIGSSVRMTLQSRHLHDFFICHICCRILWPETGIIITESTKDSNTAEEIKKASGRVSPIGPPTHPRNIGAFIDHLIDNHLNKDHVTDKANDMINELKQQVDKHLFSQLQYPRYIRKSASESSVEAKWKSNQTNLTYYMANHYSFGSRTCRGHTQRLYTRGKPYINDLAQTVYCSCSAVAIMPNIINGKAFPPPLPPRQIKHNIALGLEGSFFHENKMSIFQMHRTIYCPYKIISKQVEKIPPYTTGVKTRSRTSKETSEKDKYLTTNKDQAPSFEHSTPKKNEKPSKTRQEPKEKTIKGAKNTPIKKAAASAIELLKSTDSKKKAKELSKK